MTWLKSTWTAISAGFLVLLAIFAAMSASRQKGVADKWKDKALDIELGNVKKGTTTSAAASTQAKKHDAKADEIRAKAEARLNQAGEKDEEINTLLDRWRA